MKKSRKFLSIIFAVVFVLSLITATASAEDNEYVNNTEEINFENIDVYIADHTELILEPSSEIGLFEKMKAEKQIDEFSDYIENYPTTKSTLTDQMKTGDLLTVSYSETPFVDAGDHLEPLTSSLYSAEGDLARNGNFSFMTSIMRSGNPDSAGDYLYTVSTGGEWSVNSILSGSNYPSYGDDFVLQTVHDDMTFVSSSMLALYDDGDYVESNDDTGYVSGGIYYPTDGRPYVKYSIADDPLGFKQLQSFLLVMQYRGPAKTRTRNIGSLYIHTWKAITISSVTVTLTPTQNGDMMYAIAATLSSEDKQWPLPSSVTFNF